MKKTLLFITTGLFLIMLSGCLSVESKEYSFKLNKGKSGTGTIKFINIMSDNKDSSGTPDADYTELIDSYLKGDKLKEDLPNIKNAKKRLFEEDNQLCGELTFDFDDITKLRFYEYKDQGPWCYYLAFSPLGIMGGSESYFSSNGIYGGENMPIIFWDGSQKEFTFKTTVTSPGKTTISLLDMWNEKGDK